MDLLLEVCAYLERVSEVRLGQHEHFGTVIRGGACGVSRLIYEERTFAEEFSRTEGREVPVPSVLAGLAHIDETISNQKEFLTTISFPNDDLVLFEILPFHLPGNLCELGHREMLEQLEVVHGLPEPCGLVSRFVGSDAIDSIDG